ncbi:hypothetical protein P879_09733 [Paragonimus westermani]|uniref:Uncharacterized protein n=1 Tax=Paragonimus westermani TaxID=34504 RepID=A0A8T0D7S5_9TREM|nr:hypothetical protein P879_09733 [Paragonimus westermani]
MALKFGSDDYVRVPLPHNLDTNDDSEPDMDGVIEPKEFPVRRQICGILNFTNSTSTLILRK